MIYLRAYLEAATEGAIARRTAGMRPVSLDRIDVAPRACTACRAAGTRGGGPCAACAGTGTTRRITPVDPTQVILVHGPCGTGHQWLVAVALTHGGVAYAHVRRGGGGEDVRIYAPARARRSKVVPLALRRAGG